MGLHMLEGLPGTMQLYQLAVPGLEERVRVLPALQTREQIGAGQVNLFGMVKLHAAKWLHLHGCALPVIWPTLQMVGSC